MTDDPGRQSAASAAAERVRAIVEAAERSAEELEQAARAEADRVRGEAVREAQELRARARAQVEALAERAEQLERELVELAAAARASIAALAEEARRAAAGLGAEGEPGGAAAEEPEVADVKEPAPPGPTVTEAGRGRDEGARLIALNMALSGTPREETALYLEENFELGDIDALLDDVYQRAG